MMVLNCPFEGCTYGTGDIEAAQVIALFSVHRYSHALGTCQQAKPDKLSRPKKYKESTSRLGVLHHQLGRLQDSHTHRRP